MTLLKKLFLILIGNQSKLKLEADDPYHDLTDEELVKKIVMEKNQMVFSSLYDRYAKKVYNKCYGFAKNKDEAEDLTQDVFLLLYVKLGTFKGKSRFSTWLYSLTYNFCTNYVNRDKQRKISDKSMSMQGSEEKLSVDDVSDKNLFQLQTDKLKKALALIAPEDKSILLLKYQDSTPIKELALFMEIGESAVKMRLKRAKARIVETYNKLP